MLRRFCIALVLSLAFAGSAQSYERIRLFDSDVRVQTNGDLIVTETITT